MAGHGRTSAVVLAVVLAVLVVARGGAAAKPDCGTCNGLVGKFKEGFAKTTKAGFGGGNTAWEERALGDYATSETRLFEIMEEVCRPSDYKCHSLLEEHEEAIEDWWSSEWTGQGELPDLHKHLCIEAAKACCPAGHYGKKCKPCPRYSDHICGAHGSCSGDGTRGGKGKCSCHDGYSGTACETCTDGHFRKEFGGEGAMPGVFMCDKCDPSCSTCSGPATEHCHECAKGYEKQGEACVDVDECTTQADKGNCASGTFCSNNEGGFSCESCDVACEPQEGCTGPGALACVECAEGYEPSSDGDKACVDIDECLDQDVCPLGKYCFNKPGEHRCYDCDMACNPEKGCTSSGPAGCVECNEGYYAPPDSTTGYCLDVDECKSNPCEEGQECINSVGSFECKAKDPAVAPAKDEL